ncbi:CaiB/BaiF CoA transferase family protein [Ramlibacter sp.]|uniref:CaiB/BaiF CoA transferase family protein n=1 Tax=Ramlibacter sp. TaxID=1917967 RepID=UPI003D1102FA
MAGPLDGLRMVEMAGLGPGPFCGMLFADLGAEVVVIDRPGAPPDPGGVTARGKRRLALDLQQSAAREAALALIGKADLLVEGFRPGVMERLGLGPAECHARNARLVYGRITGWGQTGPLAAAAGHDINYIALTGALHAIGRAGEPPPPPLNYVGDYGGGAMLLAVGLLAALHEARRSGQGQVVDAAMTDGAALLSSMFYGLKAAGEWGGERGGNLLDGGAHFYDTYACADGRFVAIGPLETKFFRRLCELCGLDEAFAAAQMERAQWPMMKLRLADMFRTRTRDEWCALLEGSDACFAPVLDFDEAPQHPHNRARSTFVTLDGVVQPAPAPRFSRTPAAHPRAGASDSVESVLDAWSATPGGAARG